MTAPTPVAVDDFAAELAVAWREAKSNAALWADRAKGLETLLLDAAGNAEALTLRDAVIATVVRRSEYFRLDTDGLRQRYPDVYHELCTKRVPPATYLRAVS